MGRENSEGSLSYFILATTTYQKKKKKTTHGNATSPPQVTYVFPVTSVLRHFAKTLYFHSFNNLDSWLNIFYLTFPYVGIIALDIQTS